MTPDISIAAYIIMFIVFSPVIIALPFLIAKIFNFILDIPHLIYVKYKRAKLNLHDGKN